MALSERRYPRTWRGWKALFWLAMGRCPIHLAKLRVDDPIYDDGRSAYCFKCDGIGVWPSNAGEALRQNYRAEQKKGAANG